MRTRLRLSRTLGAVLAAALAGCAVGPDYHAPKANVPGRFASAPGTPAPAAGATIDPVTWWHALNDARLDALVEQAVQSNPDIEIALTRLQEARAFESALTGRALPYVDAAAGAGRGTGSDLTRSRVPSPLTSASNTAGLQHVTTMAGFDAAWEVDLFGRYRREIEAARYDTQAHAAARNAVLITVVADVVRAYLGLRGLQMQQAILQQDIGSTRTLLELVQARYDRGITNELDVTLAHRQLATLQAKAAPLAAQASSLQYAIAVLLGRFPEDVVAELAAPDVIPQIPDNVDAGLPIDVVRRRPDIAESERLLAGATARIGVATARLFPTLVLSASAGVQAQGLGVTPHVDESIWSAGAGALVPLLDFGTLDALANVADLRTHEQLVAYRQTVLRAMQEVDVAMAGYVAQRDRLRHLGEALAASQRALDLASQRYDRGLTDFLNVVDAQRAQYDLEEQYAAAQVGVGEQFVALYKSLGGGWENYQSIPAIRDPQPAVIAAFRRLLAPDDPLK
ncbi:MAG TPA: efflux transporter outer membrane subunit [Burkholderiales bacterium]|nr:efflux transporter outer membrane subunit [Burkholderiales bacterium]